MIQPTIDPYVLVCDDMHGAPGLFTSLQGAVAYAREASKNSECMYRVVPIRLFENVEFITTKPVPPSPEGIEHNRGGGYL